MGHTFLQKRAQRAWEGWKRLLDDFSKVSKVWDVGCGNGRFIQFLANHGVRLRTYTGWDQSPLLIEEARRSCANLADQTEFVVADLLGHRGPKIALPANMDRICLFGVLHHIPSFDVRVALIRDLMKSLVSGGQLVVTLWRFRTRGRPTRTVLPSDVGRVRFGRRGFPFGVWS